MDDKISKSSEINLKVFLNENNVPLDITWEATDQNKKAPESCKGFLLSLFERNSKDTLKIDLWTQDMQVQEMDRFIFNTLRSISDSYVKATGNKELANDLMKFTEYFGQQTKILTTDS